MNDKQDLPWFFFGSLMDIDILSCVIGRPVIKSCLQPAVLPGFERLRLLDEAYPALRPRPGAEVFGMLAAGIGDDEAERICFFEGDEFSRQIRPVHLIGEKNVKLNAWVFLAGQGLRFDVAGWDFEYWLRAEKAQYLVMAGEFMAGYGTADWGDLDQQWQATRRDNNLNNS